jgi:rubrerythrin
MSINRAKLQDFRAELTAAVERAAVEMCGAQRVTGPVPGTLVRFAPRPMVQTLPALQTAGVAHNHMTSMISELACRARAEGATWQDVAERLTITGTAEKSAGQAAFDQLVRSAAVPDRATPASWGLYGPTLTWTCLSCNQLIEDGGPAAGHPDEQESGHDEDCARHTNAVRAYEAARLEG